MVLLVDKRMLYFVSLKCGTENISSSQTDKTQKKLEGKSGVEGERLSNFSDGGRSQYISDAWKKKCVTSHTHGGCYNTKNLVTLSNTNKNIGTDDIRKACGPCGNLVVFILVGDRPDIALRRTAKLWKKQFEIKIKLEHEMWHASLEFDNVELSRCVHTKKETAKRIASILALDKLLQTYYTVKIKVPYSGGSKQVVEAADGKKSCEKNDNYNLENKHKDTWPFDELNSLDDNTVGITNGIKKMSLDSPSCISDSKINFANDKGSKLRATNIDKPLDDDNDDLSLLEMMGLSVDIGENQLSVVESFERTGLMNLTASFDSEAKPIKPEDKGNEYRGGGMVVTDKNDNINQCISRLRRRIDDYKHSDDCTDLVFSSDFTKTQRYVLHMYAQSIGLKSKSYGSKNGSNRHLVISKELDNWTIIDGLVKDKHKFCQKYELLRPGEKTATDFFCLPKN